MNNKKEKVKVKAQFIFVVPFVPAIFAWILSIFSAIGALFIQALPTIWTSFIDAIVVFFTTLGLETWIIKRQEEKDKKDKKGD